jgi:hypothetical protein
MTLETKALLRINPRITPPPFQADDRLKLAPKNAGIVPSNAMQWGRLNKTAFFIDQYHKYKR